MPSSSSVTVSRAGSGAGCGSGAERASTWAALRIVFCSCCFCFPLSLCGNRMRDPYPILGVIQPEAAEEEFEIIAWRGLKPNVHADDKEEQEQVVGLLNGDGGSRLGNVDGRLATASADAMVMVIVISPPPIYPISFLLSLR